ncbi:sialate O-acetylesterase [Bifidobacterium pseudolongum]|uniref:sialate O-acetylesterase n=1 Tax=Bifidobacterium pseudolongum TaxID=1694 RepID=UPI001F5C36F7|nr:sialate O-acetylesterase [Bifidobacterium pseudolongum]
MVTVTGIAPGASGVADGGECTSGAADRTRNGSLRVAAVFSDHMVLQRETPVAVFGTAPAGGRVVVDLMDDQGVTVAQTMAVAQAYGEHETETPWLAILPALPASGPYTLRVSHETNRLEFADVMIGEVWLAGGQSNMELELHTSEHGDEAIAAAADPLLRFYNTPKAGRIDESAEAASGWEPAVAPQVAGMSAIAYHFGARLRAELGANVAVGIIDCYIGGTSITSWMSRATLIGSDAGRPYVERYEAAIAGKTEEQMRAEADEWQTVFDRWNNSVAAMKEAHPGITQPQIDAEIGPCPWPPPVTPFSERRVSAPYEAMVRRVAPYTLRGFLWYQGEEDEAQCESYRELLGLLIEEWRTLWNLGGYAEPAVGYQADAGAGAVPFIVVQLLQWIDGQVAARGEDPRHWPVIRAAQLDASETLDKATVGTHIADMALRGVYGRTDIEAESPRVVGVTPAAGGALDVTFTNARRLHWRGTTPDTMRAAPANPGSKSPAWTACMWTRARGSCPATASV